VEADWATIYSSSKLAKQNEANAAKLLAKGGQAKQPMLVLTSTYAQPFGRQVGGTEGTSPGGWWWVAAHFDSATARLALCVIQEGRRVVAAGGSWRSLAVCPSHHTHLRSACTAPVTSTSHSTRRIHTPATPPHTQVAMLLRKYNLMYYRNASYNFLRLFITLVASLLYGSLYYKAAALGATARIADVQNIIGIMFSSTNFMGITNMQSVLPLTYAERVVFYR
jgi:hypothetical protein